MKSEGKMMMKEGRGMAKADMAKSALAAHAAKPASKAHKGLKCGGEVKKYAKGGSIDGVAIKGKTKGRMV